VTNPSDARPPADIDIEPFAADGPDGPGETGRIGVVLSHGFTGTPGSMRPWAEHLAAAGYTVRLPLLPGHGRDWRTANKSKWPQWYATIEAAYDELVTRCDTVFAFGLSMGGTLVTRLAEQRSSVAGLVLVNPSYGTERKDAAFARYIAWAVPSRPSIGGDIKKPGIAEPAGDRTPIKAFVSLQNLWRVTLADLGTVRAPILMFRSRVDHVVEPMSGRLLMAGARSTTVHEVILEDSYHVATLDNDAEQIFTGSVAFIREQMSIREKTTTHGDVASP
jgi:carboxylesterase